MAQKRKLGARFTLPTEDELDSYSSGIKIGSKFSSRLQGKGIRDLEQETRNDVATKQQNRPVPNIAVQGSNEVIETGILPTSNTQSSEVITTDKDNGQILTTQSEKEVDVAATVPKATSNSIIVNTRQRGNPVLKHIRNVPWEYGDVVPDYVLGKMACALFLSLRYHNFNPEYIHDRLKTLGSRYELRIILVQVDVKDPHASLRELAKMCILADCTLILAWSVEEAGRYLETYKSYENKPADILQEKVEGDYQSKMIECLTSVKSVNKTDAVTLMSNFGSLKNIINASKEEISMCPGFGPQKAERLHKVFREPFIKKNQPKKSTETEELVDSNIVESHLAKAD